MDRYTTNIAAAQGGFIDNFIRPAYDLLHSILPEAIVNIRQMEQNKIKWKELEADYKPENKFTQKEMQDDSDDSRSDRQEVDVEEEEEEADGDESSSEVHKVVRSTTDKGSRLIKYTMNSSTDNDKK
uniref:PDEase domain-containing protein n=1 Tax=Euplotes harpa TaxID=151035 RepID=A0A7S3JER6_9SPIT|mmetsp:Transcript_3370/g.4147  ORF Transcript_3370/g.4147 Transcript_3370/m.4147 type:complete len:127 (+) Transcript_3370:292-672(+)